MQGFRRALFYIYECLIYIFGEVFAVISLQDSLETFKESHIRYAIVGASFFECRQLIFYVGHVHLRLADMADVLKTQLIAEALRIGSAGREYILILSARGRLAEYESNS